MFVFEDECPRERKDCKPISNIIADHRVSFFCCGENDGTNRPVNQDKYTFCFKGPHRDEMSHNDKRDLMHNAAVLTASLAWIENEDCSAYHKDLVDSCDTLIANAVIGPDTTMDGATDCYHVPIEDVEALKHQP